MDGSIFAKRREDGKFILVPPDKVERNRDNPDGRNHTCAPPPTHSNSFDTVCTASHWEAPYEVSPGEW